MWFYSFSWSLLNENGIGMIWREVRGSVGSWILCSLQEEKGVSAGRMESLSCDRLCKKPLSHYISSMDPQPGIFTDCHNLLFNFHKINWICKKRSSNYFWKKTPLLKLFKRPRSLLLARDFFLMLQHLLLFQLTWSNHPTGPFLFPPQDQKPAVPLVLGVLWWDVSFLFQPPASADNELLNKIFNFYYLLLA